MKKGPKLLALVIAACIGLTAAAGAAGEKEEEIVDSGDSARLTFTDLYDLAVRGPKAGEGKRGELYDETMGAFLREERTVYVPRAIADPAAVKGVCVTPAYCDVGVQ